MPILEEKYQIIRDILASLSGTDPIELASIVMKNESISIHGPEHHFLDGAAFLTALKNAGMGMDYEQAVSQLAKRALSMPGAMCGYWGVCGSVASLGAVFSILDETGPLSKDDAYKNHMGFTSQVISAMGKIGGPRCCKRNAYLSILYASEYAEKHYGVRLDLHLPIRCSFSSMNKDCLNEKCPFFVD